MTKYTTFPTKAFLKEVEKLSDAHKQAVFNKVARLEDNPFHPSLRTKKLKGNSGCYESSVNMDIRIIWEFDDNAEFFDDNGNRVCNIRVIVLFDVGHHDVLKKY